MKKINNVRVYLYNIKKCKTKKCTYKKLHVYNNIVFGNSNSDFGIRVYPYEYNHYVSNIDIDTIEKILENCHSNNVLLTRYAILNGNNLEIIASNNNKKTFELFKEKVKEYEDCKVYAIPETLIDKIKIAYEFSKIEFDEKNKIRKK